MKETNNKQNSVIFHIDGILNKMSNQVNFLIRNNKLMNQLDVDLLMENTRKLYDTLCSVKCNMDVDSIPMEVEEGVQEFRNSGIEEIEGLEEENVFEEDEVFEEEEEFEEDEEFEEEEDEFEQNKEGRHKAACSNGVSIGERAVGTPMLPNSLVSGFGLQASIR